MKLIYRYLKKTWIPFIIAMTCLTFEAMFDLLQPTFMSKIIDVGVANKDMDYVLKMGLIMLGVTAVGALMAVIRSILATTLSQRIGASMRLDLYAKILSLSQKDVDQFDTGSLITRLTNDVTQVQNFIMGIMRIFVKAPLLCIGSIIMTIYLSPRMAILITIIVPVVSFLLYLNLRRGYPLFAKVQKSLDKVNERMRQYLEGVRVVKAYNRFDYEEERFNVSNQELKQTTTESMQLLAIFLPLITLTVNMGIVALIWFGGLQVKSGQLEVGKIIAIVNYMLQILTSMVMISNIITVMVRTLTSSERIQTVLHTENTMPKIHGLPRDTGIFEGRIDFQNVSTSYSEETEEEVLKNISFTCLPGETLGIIGSTGSGKSTLIHLITRFYDCTKGEVLLDGHNVKALDPSGIREHIGLVPQKALLFSGTIRENLLWGKKDATEEEMVQATQIAQAYEFIKGFEDGFDTVLGQGGVNLSGGQKQRVSIARALIKNPKILILDDCTSAVDVTTEARIRKGIEAFSKDLTTVIVAQRITSVMSADQILVLENGEIVGKGTHQVLMDTCEVYQDIYASQIGTGAVNNG